MIHKFRILLIAALFISAPGSAQTVQTALFKMKDDGKWQKAPTTHRLSQFPKIHSDGRVWFRYKAPPTAVSVKVHISNADFDMQKDSAGLWNAVVTGIETGYQIYWLLVDGIMIPDPGSDIYYSNGYITAIEMPAPTEQFFLPKMVPHGEVREHWFYSKVTETYRRMFVYTPPGYDKDFAARYPVLYLQHGAGEAENEWTHSGKMNFILDNLIAEGKAKPMIVVMNNGFATRPSQAGQTLTGNARWSAFEEMLINEVIPDIDKYYRTMPDRANRAMAGLSMGGMQTLTIGVNRFDYFSHLGIFSGVPANHADLVKGIIAEGEAFNKKGNLLWFGAGTEEASFINRQKELEELLKKAGINAKFYISEGTAHEFMTWRRCLYQFAPLLFKGKN